MDFITDLFIGSGMSSILVYLCLTATVGVAVGKIEIKGVRLGISGVLFAGLIFAHLKAAGGSPQLDGETLHFVKEFGLILFIYAIGVDVGPRFFSSFRSEGLSMNILAMSIVLLGFAIALGLHFFGGLSPAVSTGVLCGAVTNTPGLGAAQQALAGNPEEIATAGMAYAVAYPFGVIGLILAMVLIRLIFKIKTEKETDNYVNQLSAGSVKQLESVTITLTNPNLFGKEIEYLKELVDKELAISRIFREGQFIAPMDKEILIKGDIIYGVSASHLIDNLNLKIGPVEIGNKREITGALAMFNVLVTNRKIAGKTIEQIGIYRRYEANITRIFRAGMEILPTLNTTLELGDTVRIVGKRALLPEIRNEIGNSVKELSIPNTIPIFLGIFLGVVLGSLPIAIPGLPAPAKLGLAGGPLIVAILLGYKGRIGKLDFYMTPGANSMLRELGITLFLACVGLSSGTNFANTVNNGGLMWMLYGALITFVPVMIVAIIARLMKFNYLKICGIISGAMTDPPALEYANSIAPTQAQSTSYATVYPLTMFMRILTAQILILATL